MIFDMLIIFAIVTIICFIISVFLLEDYPQVAVAFIVLGMIFSVVTTYGFFDVEIFYTSYNATLGNTTAQIYKTDQYGNPYGYIFFVMFFMFMLLFFRAGWNCVNEAMDKDSDLKHR